MIKKSLVALTIIAILVFIGAMFLDKALVPDSQENRNFTNTNTYLDLNIENDERDAIVRTFNKQQFSKLAKNDRIKIIEKTSGYKDSDIPNIELSKSPKVNITFYNDNGQVIFVENPKLDIYDTQFTLSNTGSEFTVLNGINLEKNGDSYTLPVNLIENISKNNYGTFTLAINYEYNKNSYISYTAVTYSK